MTGVDLSVVIPVYDNEKTLDELLDRLLAVLDALPGTSEVICVDDGSRDGSVARLEARRARDPRIRPIALARNFGGQSAVCAGFDQVRGRRVVCLDADLENLPEDVPALLAALDAGADLVCGVREQRGGRVLLRQLPSALMNAYVKSRLPRTVRDIGCGMRAMDARLVRGLETCGEQRRFLTPLLLERAHRVVEVPIRHQPRGQRGGHSFLTLLAIAGDFFLITAGRPFLITGLVAASLVGVGGALLVAAALRESAALALAGLVLAVGGVVGGIASLVGEFAQRLYALAQGRPYYELRNPPAERAPEEP